MIFERVINVIFLNTILAFILRDILDGAVKDDTSLMTRALVLASGAFLIGVPLVCVLRYIINRYVRKMMTDLRVRLFRHLGDLTVSHFEHHHTGDLISRMTNDLEILEGIYSYFGHLSKLLGATIFGLVSILAIFILDWRFGFLVLLLGLITILVNTVFAKPLRRVSDLIQKHWSTLTERLMDLLQSLPETKIFHIEPVTHQAYTQTNEEMSVALIKHGRIDALFNTTDYLLGNFRAMGLLALGLFMLLMGDPIEVGTIAAIIHLQGNANYTFSNIASFITGIQRSLAGASRVLELLDTSIEPDHYPTPKEQQIFVAEPIQAIVEIRDVSFGYETNGTVETIVLHNIDLSIAQGQMAALVGPSGGGKSTIIKLLLGFYPLKEGNIMINGKSLGQYSLSQLRDKMAYVSQDAYLFDGTIEENIRYGKPDATEDEIIVAAQVANAHDFILDQPNGYHTLVGERGTKLSGGQRQRIAIARALLKDAPILLLDEATSALDSESEQLVQDALNMLIKRRTTIAIAHRLSTIEQADVIYVIDKGRVVEQGQHHDLIANDNLYKQLYEFQFRQDSGKPSICVYPTVI
jgi:ABC-type multidrug transport system fused ATPase/permease subunit